MPSPPTHPLLTPDQVSRATHAGILIHSPDAKRADVLFDVAETSGETIRARVPLVAVRSANARISAALAVGAVLGLCIAGAGIAIWRGYWAAAVSLGSIGFFGIWKAESLIGVHLDPAHTWTDEVVNRGPRP